MPIGQLGAQLIGQYNSAVLAPAGTIFATGSTSHFAEQPVTAAATGSNPFVTSLSGYAIKAGAPVGSGDVLYSAGKYLTLVIVITAIGTGTLTVTVGGCDAASNTFYSILASAALAANATTILRVGPTYTAAANLVANDIIPLTWNVQVVVGGTSGVTASIGAFQGA